MADDIKSELEGIKKLIELNSSDSQNSLKRTFLSAERTHAAWIRTAISTMTFGIAIDKFGLLLFEISPNYENMGNGVLNTQIIGASLVALSIIIALGTGIRYTRFFNNLKTQSTGSLFVPQKWLPITSMYMTVTFGLILLFLILAKV